VNEKKEVGMQKFLFVVGILILRMTFSPLSVKAETLKMGYRTNERLPLIGESPDNSGLYYDLYKRAAEKINCELEVVRSSKKRVIEELQEGVIDFYPGFNFDLQRAEFTYYLENGLPGGDVGISRLDLPEVTDLNQLKGKTLLVALGVSDITHGVEGINIHEVAELEMDRAIQMIQNNRGDFYIYNKDTVDYYMMKENISDLKVHPNCCGGIVPLYLGFSRKSSKIKEIPNPNYDATKEVSIENFPVTISPDCLAYKFAQALKEMKENGELQTIYDKYYKKQEISKP
jgi:ABC-type amino acid transport substrate-binding protein